MFSVAIFFNHGSDNIIIGSYPLDTIRRRMMMTSGEKVHYKNMVGLRCLYWRLGALINIKQIDCGAQIVRNEGVATLFKVGFLIICAYL